MKRVFLILGVTALAASGASLLANPFVCAAMFIGLGILFTFWPWGKKAKSKTAFLLIICLLFLLRFVFCAATFSLFEDKVYGRSADIEATITEIDLDADNYTRFTVKIDDSSLHEAIGRKVICFVPIKSALKTGDTISAGVTFEKLPDRYAKSNLSSGVTLSAEVDSYTLTHKNHPNIYSLAATVRDKISSAIDSSVSGGEAGVIKAFLIGEKTGLENSLMSAVRSAGVSHMTVVSGLHLGIMCGLIVALCSATSSRKLTLIISGAFILILSAMCLFHTSVIRAGICYIVTLVARTAVRTKDLLNALGLAVCIVVFIWPFAFYDVGFMLSVTATLAMIYPASMLTRSVNLKHIGRFSGPLLESAFGILVATVSASIYTLPVMVCYFDEISLISPISNLLLSFAVSFALQSALVAVIFFFIPVVGAGLSLPFFFVARLCAAYFIFVIQSLAGNPASTVQIGEHLLIGSLVFAVLYTVAIKLLYKHTLKRKERFYLAQRQNSQIVSPSRGAASRLYHRR